MDRKYDCTILADEDPTTLYIGRIIEDSYENNEDQDQNQYGGEWVGKTSTHVINFKGYLLFYGSIEEGSLRIKALSRLALRGTRDEPLESWKLGVLSLVGPLDESNFEEEGNLIRNVRLRLHHQRVKREKEQYGYAYFPEKETLLADIELDQIESEDDALRMTLTLNATRNSPGIQGGVEGLNIKAKLLCQPSGSEPPLDTPKNSILSHCPDPGQQPCPSNQHISLLEIPIKIFDFFKGLNPTGPKTEDVLNICKIQVEKACQVWRDQGPLSIRVWRNQAGNSIFQGSTEQKRDFHRIGFNGTTALERRDSILTGDQYVGVYLVDQIDPVDNFGEGGAFAGNCGTASAYIVMQVDEALHNEFLLAHELGHVLGLDHPPAGSPISVMQPGLSISGQNSRAHCQIFLQSDLNPIVQPVGPTTCISPH